jgi:hypothetical protein
VTDLNRDASVLLPGADLEGFSDLATTYLDVAVMTRALVLAFEHGLCCDIEEVELAPLLTTTAADTYWTERSWRAMFATWASALLVSKKVYEMFGRWKAESRDSVAGYVRTMKRRSVGHRTWLRRCFGPVGVMEESQTSSSRLPGIGYLTLRVLSGGQGAADFDLCCQGLVEGQVACEVSL